MRGPEGAGNIENFESIMARVKAMYANEGLSDNVEREIENWYWRERDETKREGGSVEQRAVFHWEWAQLYIEVGKLNQALEIVEGAITQLDEEREAKILIYDAKRAEAGLEREETITDPDLTRMRNLLLEMGAMCDAIAATIKVNNKEKNE